MSLPCNKIVSISLICAKINSQKSGCKNLKFDSVWGLGENWIFFIGFWVGLVVSNVFWVFWGGDRVGSEGRFFGGLLGLNSANSGSWVLV
jgi:hypothetical protein